MSGKIGFRVQEEVSKMENRITVAVDAMGGDNAPFEIIKGAVEAVKERENVSVLLTGQEAIIKKERR